MLITDRVMHADLIVVRLVNHEVIGMDWLGKNRATLECHRGMVQFESGCRPPIKFQGLERIGPLLTVTEEGCSLRVGVDPDQVPRYLSDLWILSDTRNPSGKDA